MSDVNMNSELDELYLKIEQLEAESSLANPPIDAEPCNCDEETSQAEAKRFDDQTKINLGGETSFPGLENFQEVSGPIAQAGALRIRATIDATRTDNGFLGCVYARYRAASNMTVRSHSSTLGASYNLRYGSEGWSIIVGHGAPGLIVTGTGQTVNGIQKYIARNNEYYWRPILSRGVIGGGLTLFGCEVASGTAGLDLLRRVASAIRKPVGAWTGTVWCSNTSVWGTGTFVTVRPGVAVGAFAAEEAPSMYSDEQTPLRVMLLASHEEDFEKVGPDQITSVEFTPIGSFSDAFDFKTVRAERTDALSILQRIDLENPFVTEDKPGSVQVGMLNVSYGVAGDQDEHARIFRVLGSSLIQDMAYPNTYYYASQELQQLLR
jgi:hypothetical protein